MTMFEVFTKEVEINGTQYKLKPLSGRFMPKFFKVLKALEKASKSEDEFVQHLDEEAMGHAHELVLETFKKSYPQEKVEQLDEFVSQHLNELLPALAEVNMHDQSEKEAKK